MNIPPSSSKNALVVSEALQPVSEWWKSNGNQAFSYLLVLAPPLMASSVVSDAFFSTSDLAVLKFEVCSFLIVVK
jgi:hypothetical protein